MQNNLKDLQMRWVFLSYFFASSVLAIAGTEQAESNGRFKLEQAGICSPSMAAGTVCEAEISDFRPGQSALGFKEVGERASKIAKMGSGKLHDYIVDHTVPVVIGPGGALFATDHHHYMAAMLKAGANQGKVLAKVIKDWSKLSDDNFWTAMNAQHFIYLYDEHGAGPILPGALPNSVKEMRDDPYRSFAWAVRKSGGYEETTIYFADFQWANFFRSRLNLGRGNSDFNHAVLVGVKMAHSPEARILPGYLP